MVNYMLDISNTMSENSLLWFGFRLLDSFHDLNKIICQRFTKANGISRELLLKTLQLEQHQTVSTKPSNGPVKFPE